MMYIYVCDMVQYNMMLMIDIGPSLGWLMGLIKCCRCYKVLQNNFVF